MNDREFILSMQQQIEDHLAGGPVDPPPVEGPNSYYDNTIIKHPKFWKGHALRDQSEINAISTGGEADNRWDVIYDPVHDAMLQRGKGERTLADGTIMKMGVNMEQKLPFLGISGKTGILLTHDFKIGPGAAYLGTGSLLQYKAHRIDSASGVELWLSTKTLFTNRWNPDNGNIAEIVQTGGWFMGPGTTNPNSEILEPRVNRFTARVNKWVRYWLYVEGKLSGATAEKTELVKLYIWVADKDRGVVQLYNGINYYSPVQDIRRFRYEYNTSQTGGITNPQIDMWARNFGVLQGLTLAEVTPLLVAPID